jgi:hypothetical protein
MGFSQYKSPFNHKVIAQDSVNTYTFIVTGHLYGDGANLSHYPANTILANLDLINDSNAKMFVNLGDLFLDVKKDKSAYEKSLFNKLQMPLVNTVGNHDLSGTFYQDNYGETSFLFKVNGDLHLVLDSERNNGDIKDDQLELIDECIELAKSGNYSNTFIYMHRTLWKDAYPEMQDLFTTNTQSLITPNYEKIVLPKFKTLAKLTDVYLFSGSLGEAPASFFYFKDEPANIQIIATAIRSLPRDAILKVQVREGAVSFETISLTGETLLPLTAYDINFWNAPQPKADVNWGLVFYKIKMGVTHRYFWSGVLVSTLFLLSLFFILRKRLTKK